jgi:hypothetical protein
MLWVVIAFVFIALVVLAALKFKSVPVNEEYPYERQAALFTPAERSFLGVLEQSEYLNRRRETSSGYSEKYVRLT